MLRIKLEITIARKVLPHTQGIKGSMRNMLNKGLFSLYDPALPGRDVRWNDLALLKISHSARFSKKRHCFLEIDYS
jgi:hypothetical protein